MKITTSIVLLFLSLSLYSQKLLKNINPGNDNSDPNNFLSVGSKSFFLARNNVNRMYVFDRTTNITSEVKQSPEVSNLSGLFEFDQELYVWGSTFQEGTELYKLNSLGDSLVLFKEFIPGQPSATLNTIVKGQNKFYLFFDYPFQLWVSDGSTANTSKVLDYNSTNYDTKLCVGDNLFFLNFTAENGKELWFSDGSTAGTHLVKDIFPGPTNSYISHMAGIDNSLIFNAYTAGESHEPWISDGTEANTRIIQEIVPGTNGSFPNTFITFNNEVYFTANGQQLYKTNGSLITFLGNVGSFDNLNTIVFNNELYFIGNTSEHGFELWKTNGTLGGTNLVADVFPGNQSGFLNSGNQRGNFEIINNHLIFSATNGINGVELMKFDGTTVSLVKDFVPGSADSYLGKLFKIGNEIIMAGVTENNERELWVSDGTTLGTRLIKSVNPALNLSNTFALGTNDNDMIFVSFTDSLGFEPWKYNSITKNINLLKDIGLLPRRTFQNFYQDFNMQPIGNKSLFWANDGKHGNELWVTDGTTVGTYLLKDFSKYSYGFYDIGDPYKSYYSNTFLNSWSRFNNEIYMVVNNKEIWKIDENLNMQLLFDLGFISSTFQVKLSMANADDKLYFTFGPNRYLFQTDGTVNGTFQTDYQTTLVNIYGTINSELIFSGELYPYGRELFKSVNGVTSLIKDINGSQGSSIKIVENVIKKIGNKIIFEADNGISGSELWVTDGTELGTLMIKDFNIGGSSFFNALNFKVIGDRLIFEANDGVSGNELWKTDGTPAGTVLLKDISVGSPSSSFEQHNFIVDSAYIIYQINDNQNDLEPWITDGTSTNTKLLNNYTTGGGRSFIDPAIGVQKKQNELFLIINNNFWITDIATGLSRNPQFLPNASIKNGSIFTFKGNVYCFASEYDGEYKTYLYKYENNIFRRQLGFNLNHKQNQPFLVFYPNVIGNKLIFKVYSNDEEYYVSEICDEVVNLTTDILNGGTQKANMLLNSSGKILTQEKVFFTSEKSIILNPGFKTNSNGVFNAQILGCTDLN